MNQLTIRGFDDELRHRIEALAREREISLNRAAVLLIRRGAGLEHSRTRPHGIGDGLDEFIGSRSQAEEAKLLASIEAAEQVEIAT